MSVSVATSRSRAACATRYHGSPVGPGGFIVCAFGALYGSSLIFEGGVPLLGLNLARLAGLCLFGILLLEPKRRFVLRGPNYILIASFGFVVSAALSLLNNNVDVRPFLTLLQLSLLLLLLSASDRGALVASSLRAGVVLGATLATVVIAVNYMRGAAANVEKGIDRFSALGIDPNHMAFRLAVAIFVAWCMAVAAPVRRRRHALTLLSFVFGFGILLTGSRGGIAGVVFGVSVALLLAAVRGARRATADPNGVSIGRRLVAFMPVGFAAYATTRSAFSAVLVRVETEGNTASLGGRIDIWRSVAPLYGDLPVWGYGYGSFAERLQEETGKVNEAHNVGLAVLLEQGWLGLAVFVLLVLAWVHGALCSDVPSPGLAMVATAVASAMVLDLGRSKLLWILPCLFAGREARFAYAGKKARRFAELP